MAPEFLALINLDKSTIDKIQNLQDINNLKEINSINNKIEPKIF